MSNEADWLVKELRQQIAQLQEQNFQLRSENERLKNKPIWEVARERGIPYKPYDGDYHDL